MEIDVVTVALCVEQEAHVSREPYEKMQQPLANSLFRAIHEFAGAHRTSKESPKLATTSTTFLSTRKTHRQGTQVLRGFVVDSVLGQELRERPHDFGSPCFIGDFPCTLIEMPSRPCS